MKRTILLETCITLGVEVSDRDDAGVDVLVVGLDKSVSEVLKRHFGQNACWARESAIWTVSVDCADAMYAEFKVAPLTTAQVLVRKQEITELVRQHDQEAASSSELHLMADVLKSIVVGAHNPKELARAALREDFEE